MMRKIVLAATALAVLLLSAAMSWADDSHSLDMAADPLVTIESAFNAGEISLDEKVLLQIKAIKHPDQLPAKYAASPDARYKSNSRYATSVLRDIWLELDKLSPDVQAAYSAAFLRDESDTTYGSPGGHFLLHYDTTGSDSVPLADLNTNGVPDFIEHIAAYCDTSLDTQIGLGYLPPVSDGTAGGDDRIDIYFSANSSYGYTIIEGNGPAAWNDGFGYITLNRNFEGFPPNDDPEGDVLGAAKVTVAHELHHLIQFAYDVNEPSWFIEMDATYMEDLVFDASNDNYNYLDSFFLAPGKSLMDNGLHKYASFIYPLFLSQVFDTSLMVAVWEGARYATAFNTLSDTLMGRYGWTQDSAFAEFAVWNYITNIRDDGLHHEEASNYPLIHVASQHTIYPVPTQNAATAPAGYAAGYVEFFPPATPNILQITFNGDNTHDWAAFLIKSTSENVHEVEKLTPAPPDYQTTVQIEDAQDYYRITLVGVNISEFGTGALFTYSANSFVPREVASSIITPFSEVYSGGLRSFQYQVSNPAPLNDIYDVTVWDDSSWIGYDSFQVAIPSGGDYLFTQDYGPPQGTPISNTARLYFAARSVNNPAIADTQSISVETILQRGDVNFSGNIDVADITAIVSYMFKNGPPPIPILDAADFTCDGSVDVNDLTRLVAFQFKNGDPSPCNPY